MKIIVIAIAAVVLCGCATSDRGGMGNSSNSEIGGSSLQRENVMRNHVSDNVKNPSSNWNTF